METVVNLSENPVEWYKIKASNTHGATAGVWFRLVLLWLWAFGTPTFIAMIYPNDVSFPETILGLIVVLGFILFGRRRKRQAFEKSIEHKDIKPIQSKDFPRLHTIVTEVADAMSIGHERVRLWYSPHDSTELSVVERSPSIHLVVSRPLAVLASSNLHNAKP